MLSYHYPPAIASGCVRIKRFVDNLPLFDYEPLVVTIKSKDNPLLVDGENVSGQGSSPSTKVALPEMLVRRLFNRVRARSGGFRLEERLFLFPDNAVGFVPHAISKSLKVYRDNPYDLIFVTCRPFSTALAGVYLKKKLNIPLVVDFRDPYAYDYHERVPAYHALMKKSIERYVLNNTDCLITNTQGGEELYKQFYPDLKITTINNGFDQRSNCSAKPVKNDRMIISHVGHLYGLKRNPDRLFAAMARMKNSRITFRSIGDTYKGIMETARQYGIEDKIEIMGSLPHEQALAKIQASDVLFISQLSYVDKYFSISIANKSFEYLETGKPVIADLPEGDNAELFRNYSHNSYVITNKDPDQIYFALNDLYEKWLSDELHPSVNEKYLARFNGKVLTQKLSEVFDTVLQESAT